MDWIATRDRRGHFNFATWKHSSSPIAHRFDKNTLLHKRFIDRTSAASRGLRLRHPRPYPAPRAHPPPVVHAKSSPTTSTRHVPANRPSFRLSASSPARAHRTALSVSSAPPPPRARRLRGDLGVARDAQPAQRAAPSASASMPSTPTSVCMLRSISRSAPRRLATAASAASSAVAPAEQQRPQARRAPRRARMPRCLLSTRWFPARPGARG